MGATRGTPKASLERTVAADATGSPHGNGAAPSGSEAAHTAERLPVEAFAPSQVCPWRFHNRAGSGMDDVSLNALAASIRRDGQQQLGLARRLPPGDKYAVEAIFGVRRLEACRRAGVPWRASVHEASFSDAQCAGLMHGENAWTENVSPLENAVQWQAMLEAGVFANQSALAADLGCARNTVSRGIRTVTALLAEEWLARLVRPVMHDFTGRAAERLAAAYMEGTRNAAAERRAERLEPGQVAANGLYDTLFAGRAAPVRQKLVFERRRGRAGGGAVMARIERDEIGGWSVRVRAHEQSPVELAEIAEQVQAVVDAETAAGAGVRLGRRIADMLTAEEAKEADRRWLEGCVWAVAQGAGLDWDRWRSTAAAEVLRSQPEGWERAVTRAVGGREAEPGGVR